MEKYYVYCSTNQVYSTLINNAVLSKRLTSPSLRSDTVGFPSENFIFVTKDCLNASDRFRGISDSYYPVALEISDDEDSSLIPKTVKAIM